MNRPSVENGSVLAIAPGERYDVVFTADSGKNFTIEDHSNMPEAKYMKMDVVYANGNGEKQEHPKASFKVSLVAENPKYDVGSHVIIHAGHMKGMNGAKETVVGVLTQSPMWSYMCRLRVEKK